MKDNKLPDEWHHVTRTFVISLPVECEHACPVPSEMKGAAAEETENKPPIRSAPLSGA
jgi:hypothetical protein